MSYPINDELISQLVTVRDVVRFGATQMAGSNLYFGHGTDNAWSESVFLTLETLQLPWDLTDLVLDARLLRQEREQILSTIQQRIDQRIPAPYLVGRAWFAGVPFIVNENVLIPRSPIAELIANEFSPWLDREPERVLDLCTGSGCIGIATALAFGQALVDLADISPQAVDIAWQNVDFHGLNDRVQAFESDMFDQLEVEQYDLIICNPPYVDAEDFYSMPAEYQHEPELALISGDDGLDFTRNLLQQARQFLTEHGVLVCEVGNSKFALEDAFPDLEFTWVEFEQGGHGVFVLRADELESAFG